MRYTDIDGSKFEEISLLVDEAAGIVPIDQPVKKPERPEIYEVEGEPTPFDSSPDY